MVVTTLSVGQVNKPNIASINPFDLPSLLFTEKDKLPVVAGIYFVISNSNEILYIGQSTNINSRWYSTSHNKYEDFATFQNVRIAWLVVEEIEFLLGIEESFIAAFKPFFNKIGVINKPAREEFRFTQEFASRLRKYA